MALESSMHNYADVKDKAGFTAVTVTVVGKPTWTEAVIGDMLDSAAKRTRPDVNYADLAVTQTKETQKVAQADKSVKDVETGRIIFTRVYYVGPEPVAPATPAEKSKNV
jgi:hypothetical protein